MKDFNLTERQKKAACLFAAFCSTWSVTHLLKAGEINLSVSNSVLSVMVLAGIYCLYQKTLPCLNKRLTVISLVMGLFFSAALVCGANMVRGTSTMMGAPVTWVSILAASPMLAACTALVLQSTVHWNTIELPEKWKKWGVWQWDGKKLLLLCWGLIFLAWLPGLIASYPGVYGYDSVYQISFYQNDYLLLHHPLVHTYMLALCVLELGQNILGSAEAGMCVYSVIQMVLLSGTFSVICVWLKRRSVSKLLRTCFLLLFMFLPVNAILSFSSTKDVLFSAWFALLFLFAAETARDPQRLKQRKFCIGFGVVMFLFMIFRSQGKYVLLFGMVFGFLLLRRHWKRLLPLLAVVLVVFGIYSGPITTALGGIKADSIHEMMSVPSMQLSKALMDNASEISEADRTLIAAYIPDYEKYSWFPDISDQVKNTFNSDLFREHPTEFISLWVRVGLKCPETYVAAFARLTIGWWYPDMNYRDPFAWHPYWEYTSTEQNEAGEFFIVGRSTPACLQWLADFYNNMTYQNSYQRIPVVSLLFSSGFMVWIMLFFTAWCIYRKQYAYLFPAAFAVGLWLTLLLGPVVLYRYAYPLAVIVPIELGVMATKKFD